MVYCEDRTASPQSGEQEQFLSGKTVKELRNPMSRMNEVKALYPSLILVFLSMLVIMFVYELAKQMLNPSITLWESHAITIVFTSVISIIIIYFPLRSSYLQHQQTLNALHHQQEAEEKLRKSEIQYRSFVESVEDSIYTVDRDCRYLLFNARHLFRRGLSPWMYEGKRFSDFHSQEETAIFTGQVARVLESKCLVQDEYEYKGRHYLRKLSPVIDPVVNEVIAVTVISSDITERKEAEETLKQTEETLSRANQKLNLLSSITRHDVLNQLLVLNGYLQLSGEFVHDPEKTHDYLKRAIKAVTTIEAQINFTRTYQDMGSIAPSWQNVNTCIIRAKGGLSTVDIRTELHRHGLEVLADPLLEKVFYNLFDNAIRYGGEQMKMIQVSSYETPDGLVLICEDDGAGIAEADKRCLFTQGFGKNTGFGLFLSREILAISGITIRETSPPGMGARFEMTVPEGAYRPSPPNC